MASNIPEVIPFKKYLGGEVFLMNKRQYMRKQEHESSSAQRAPSLRHQEIEPVPLTHSLEDTPREMAGSRTGSLSPRQNSILQMQATQGNAAVRRMLTTLGPNSGLARNVQRFTEAGHKMIGDEAWGSNLLTLGPGLQVSFGDAVAMGDYFGSFAQMKRLAEKPGKGPGTQGEVRYVLWVNIRDQPEKAKLGDWYDKYAVHVRQQAARYLDSTNISHFPNPQEGDAARSPLQKNQRVEHGQPFGATAKYRTEHELAMQLAYAHGRKQEPMDDALTEDAFACHFLTDSFSASHVRTPRASIKEYWDKLVPGFHQKLIHWLADKIDHAHSTSDHILAPIFKGARVKTIATTKLIAALGNDESYSFGNVISLMVHDAEGKSGVEATVDGQPITLVGDSGLVTDKVDPITGQHSHEIQGNQAQRTFDAAVKAVKASIEDLHTVFQAGWDGTKFEDVCQKIKGRDGLYAAERLLPKPVEDAQLPAEKQSLYLMHPTVQQLLGDPRIQAALVEWGKLRASTFSAKLKEMDLSTTDAQALQKALLNPLASGKPDEIRRVILDIIAHS